MNKKGSPQNLTNKITSSEQAREMQKRSAASRRARTEARKSMKYTLDILLSKTLRSGSICLPEEIQNLAEAEGLNVDLQTAINIQVIQRALSGDMQAVQFIRDTIGEKPKDKVEVDQSLTIESWAKEHKVKL